MNKIILALDTTNLPEAISVVQKIKNKIFTVKLGLEFFNAHGKEGIKKFNEIGITNLMLDLKLKDIPETVYKAIKALDDIKFGIVNKPLIEFTDAFESGLINAGDYINGELVDSAINTSNLDASTYGPDTAQDTVIDAGLYLNVES